MRPGRISWIGLCCALLAVVPLSARSGGHEPWTLSRLVDYALSHNQGLEAAGLSAEGEVEGIAAARGQRRPRVDAVSRVQHYPIRDRLLIERHGRRPSNPFEQTLASYGVRVTLPLYTGGRIPQEIALAEAVVAASRAREALTRQELIFNVTSAYYSYLRLRAVIGANEGLVRSVKESHRLAQQRVRLGRAAPLDLLRLEARLSAVESGLRVARNDVERTVATLTALLALPVGTPLEVAGELTAAEAPADPGAARRAALGERPDLAALRHEIDAQRRRVGVAASRLRPSIDASAFFGAATGGERTSTDAKIFVNLQVPLYTGDVLSARKRKAAVRLRALEAKLAAAERAALAEVERALVELSSTRARLEAGARGIALAQESLRVEREKFREGRGTGNDLLLAEEALLRAKTGLAAVKADSQIALAALRFATGELGPSAE